MPTNCGAIVVTSREDLMHIIEAAVRSALKTMEQQPVSSRKKLLSPKEIHQEYGINKRILEHWRLQGVGPTFTNIGRRVFYDRAAFEKFIAAGSVKTADCANR